MADSTKLGTDWQSDELDAIVTDYFEMLSADIAGRPYVKARHNATLMVKIGRTHRSIEFKHQNISAVLDELGMPWIPGYKPKRNYQNAIFDAIDRYLSAHPRALEPVRQAPVAVEPRSGVFVSPPLLTAEKEAIPERLWRLVRKFDPLKRDYLNRSLGEAGESFVIDLERRQLNQANRPDLAKRVRWISAEDGDGAGYDVLSFHTTGKERLIEVKTTNGSARTPFFITRNECALAAERPSDWCIYRVHLFATEPHVFTLTPPLEDTIRLNPETWRASF